MPTASETNELLCSHCQKAMPTEDGFLCQHCGVIDALSVDVNTLPLAQAQHTQQCLKMLVAHIKRELVKTRPVDGRQVIYCSTTDSCWTEIKKQAMEILAEQGFYVMHRGRDVFEVSRFPIEVPRRYTYKCKWYNPLSWLKSAYFKLQWNPDGKSTHLIGPNGWTVKDGTLQFGSRNS